MHLSKKKKCNMYANVMRHTILHLTLIKKTVLCMLSFGVKAKSA